MTRVVLFLYILIALPFLAIALGLHSLMFALGILGLNVLYIAYFLLTARQRLLREIQASPLEPDHQLQRSIQRVIARKGKERIQLQFWVYPDVNAEVRVYGNGRNRLDVLFSQGLVHSVSEAKLEAILSNLPEPQSVRNQNVVDAVSLKVRRWKGDSSRFRYWLLSFWFYPLERLLKIVSI